MNQTKGSTRPPPVNLVLMESTLFANQSNRLEKALSAQEIHNSSNAAKPGNCRQHQPHSGGSSLRSPGKTEEWPFTTVTTNYFLCKEESALPENVYSSSTRPANFLVSERPLPVCNDLDGTKSQTNPGTGYNPKSVIRTRTANTTTNSHQLLAATRDKRKRSPVSDCGVSTAVAPSYFDLTDIGSRKKPTFAIKMEPEDGGYPSELTSGRGMTCSRGPMTLGARTLNVSDTNRGRSLNSTTFPVMHRCQSEPRMNGRPSRNRRPLNGETDGRLGGMPNSGLSISHLADVSAWLQCTSPPHHHYHHGQTVERPMDDKKAYGSRHVLRHQEARDFKQEHTMEYFDFDDAATSSEGYPAYTASAYGVPSYSTAYGTYGPPYTTAPADPSYTSMASNVSSSYAPTSSYPTSTSTYDSTVYGTYRPEVSYTESASFTDYSSSSQYPPTSYPASYSSSAYPTESSTGGPYVCDFPGCQQKQQYTRLCELNKHKKTHERNYPCRFAENCKAFSTAKDRNRHESTIHKAETGGEEYICDDCGKACSRKDNLRDHRRRRHGAE